MLSTSIIFPTIVALIIFILSFGVLQRIGRQETMQERIKRLAGSDAEATLENIEESLRLEPDNSPLALFLSQIVRLTGVNPKTYHHEHHLRFYRAGLLSSDATIYYLFCKRILVFVLLLLALFILTRPVVGKLDTLMHYIIGGLILIAAVFGPDLYISNRAQKRQKILQRSFPDALDLLLVCVESGLALDGALARVCRELGRAHPEITQELNRTRLELTLLNDRTQALTNLAERTDLMAFRSLIAALLQSERFGTSLTETLRVLSEDYRNTRLMLAEEKAGRLPVLITIPLILLLLPALFLIICGPAALSAYASLHK